MLFISAFAASLATGFTVGLALGLCLLGVWWRVALSIVFAAALWATMLI